MTVRAEAKTQRGAVMVDVARLAGVSQKTVSRVVNGAPHVRPDVAERVHRAIVELGYRPNGAAQALARARTHTIGVLALGTPLYGPSRRVHALEHEARRLGWTLALATVPDLSAREVSRGIESLLQRNVEGLVVEVPNHVVDIDPRMLHGLPVVTSAGLIPGLPRQALVDTDQAEISAQLTAFLLDLGHTTVWHVGGPRDWDAAVKRQDGWRSALLERGRRVPPPAHGDWTAASGYRAGLRLAAQPEVTAVFAANDSMAMGLLRAFHEAGRRVPADVSVAGFDDVPDAEYQVVPLTTVAIRTEAPERRILAELLHMIEGAPAPSGAITVAQHRIVVRASTGPAPTP
ncbi:LacI family DNA-binding transcriptional regulator [Microlunatus flavus]|uniref:LacI family transcriptional regulator n=1 Tax=Microlunatus flavus TaxID=1036181 RepID=A0A1H9IGK8_9ACTN|nr:LacI family DNA-binding transcriptional regulator [Microlunatus flavus]SEQ73678.1 LacI family transcriptional regulator [Microlunatus flavus]